MLLPYILLVLCTSGKCCTANDWKLPAGSTGSGKGQEQNSGSETVSWIREGRLKRPFKKEECHMAWTKTVGGPICSSDFFPLAVFCLILSHTAFRPCCWTDRDLYLIVSIFGSSMPPQYGTKGKPELSNSECMQKLPTYFFRYIVPAFKLLVKLFFKSVIHVFFPNCRYKTEKKGFMTLLTQIKGVGYWSCSNTDCISKSTSELKDSERLEKYGSSGTFFKQLSKQCRHSFCSSSQKLNFTKS